MKKILLILFVCLVMLGIVVSPVSANTRTEITGTSKLLTDPPLEIARAWVSGHIYHFRGLREEYSSDFSDDCLDGLSTQSSNGNLFMVSPTFGYGPIWGTDVIENGGGFWTGTYTGKLTADGENYFVEILHGHGGYEGYTAIIRWERTDVNDPTLYAKGFLIKP
jgi:hypothetical protein